jgi:transposase
MSDALPLPPDVWERLPPEAQALIRALQAQVHALQQRVAELEARLGQNSTNSSRPPSADPPSVKRRPPTAGAGRRRGGQPGHPAAFRPLVPPEQLQQTIPCKPSACRRCGHALAGDDPAPRRHQIADLPPVRPTVIEYQLHRLRCPGCGLTTQAALPAGVPEHCCGPRLQGILALLAGGYRLGKRPICQLMQDLFGLSISHGWLGKLERTTAQALAAPMAQALAAVPDQPANVDETSFRQPGGRGWLWVAVTALCIAFLLRRSRGADALAELVGRRPRRVITSDRFKSYETLPLGQRQVCWAHLRRDFQALIDRGGAGAVIGRELLGLSDDLFFFWPRVRDGTWPRARFQEQVAGWRAEVRGWLAAGRGCGCAKAAGLCADLERLEPALWAFAFVEGVEPTNNAAERALRHAVMWRKTSYGVQSEWGARFVERVLTVAMTCRQQGRDVLAYLVACCEAWNRHQSPPALVTLTTEQAA